MQQFKISEPTYKKLMIRSMAIIIPMLIIIFLIYTLIGSRRPAGAGPNKLPLFMAFFLLFSVITVVRAYRKQKQHLQSFTITISDTGITREQVNARPIVIKTNDIREVIKTQKGSFTIRGANPMDVIKIPHWIEDADGLEKRLQAFGPIRENV